MFATYQRAGRPLRLLEKVKSGVVAGVLGDEVVIEAHSSRGLPGIRLVGLPDMAVREAVERVRSAIINSGFSLPPRKLVVNLAPAGLPKAGAHLDLPIAVAISLAVGATERRAEFNDFWLLGELSLTGEVNPVRGVLPLAVTAAESGARGIIVPAANGEEAAAAGLPVFPVDNLGEALAFLSGERRVAVVPEGVGNAGIERYQDFSDVKGQLQAKRAMEIAAAGRHNILFIGPPGSGKSMLAKRLPSILPPMSREEALEVTRVHSVRGRTREGGGLVWERPFRAPHHTVSAGGLVGGGRPLLPGELSLSHRGVLFLDEMAEFGPRLLQVLRQPLEAGTVSVARAGGSVTFPADFMLVGAMNPCPCGYNGDDKRECTCSPARLLSYRSRISGPLLDRIDFHVGVGRLRRDEILERSGAESSGTIAKRVALASDRQRNRFTASLRTNADMTVCELRRFCRLGRAEEKWLSKLIDSFGLTARGCDRLLKVARTIADLAQSDSLDITHLAEAAQYRQGSIL